MSERKSKPVSDERTLVIERIFDAPRHLLFEAWTKQEHLQKWSAPTGFTIPFAEGDVRPGGAWKCHMLAPNGEAHNAGGVYREVVPNELLVFTHGWEGDDGKIEHETVVKVRFSDVGAGKTRMNFEQGTFRSVESRDGHNGGWSQCFDKLAGYLAKFQGRKS